MAFVPTANGVKVCLRYNQNGETTCNIFHVDNGAPATLADLTTIAETFLDWWGTNLQSLQENSTALVAIECKALDSVSAPGIEFTDGLPIAGTNSSGALPNNVTVAVKWNTGLSGRSFRGRTYHVGLAVDQITGGAQELGVAVVSAFRDAYSALIDALTTLGKPLVVLSLFNGGIARSNGLMTTIINAFVNRVLDSQRRRLPERGT